MVVNGDCSFLKNGEERHWEFSGEEDWDFPLVKKEDQPGAEGSIATADGSGGAHVGGPGAVPEEGKMEESYKKEAKI